MTDEAVDFFRHNGSTTAGCFYKYHALAPDALGRQLALDDGSGVSGE